MYYKCNDMFPQEIVAKLLSKYRHAYCPVFCLSRNKYKTTKKLIGNAISIIQKWTYSVIYKYQEYFNSKYRICINCNTKLTKIFFFSYHIL